MPVDQDLERDKQYIREHAKEYLEPDGSKQGYVCPICGSGSGNKGTGITTKDGIHFTCWANNCFKNADIIDIIGLEYNCTSDREKFERAYQEFGLDNKYKHTTHKENTKAKYTSNPIEKSKQESQAKNYSKFYSTAHSFYKNTSYLKDRGITDEVADRFNIGFCKGFNYGGVTDDAIIIPLDEYSYNIRFINQTEKSQRYRKKGDAKLFNPEAFTKDISAVWAVEGEIDAMSIIVAGGEAVGLGSTSGRELLIKYLKDNNINKPIIISLDNDSAGKKTTEDLKKDLEELNIKYIVRDFSNGSEVKTDANDLLKTNKAQLIEAIKEAEQDIINLQEAELRRRKEEYKKNNTKSYINDFLNGIKDRANTAYIPTGFTELDRQLDGGLFEGLYFIGAISSLGKTTFCLQIADQIAKSGEDVLIFSLEMARSELMAKSISRETLIQGTIQNAKTTRGITTYKRYENYTKAEIDLINKAVMSYAVYSENIFIQEGLGDITAGSIRQAVTEHIELRGKKPVVLIDYLQIIAPADVRATDKQNTDKAVLELKRISRDYKIPIIGISSFNRDNYTSKVSMQAFKESGAIEYSSDILIGLQFKGQGTTSGVDVDEAKAKSNTPEGYRDIELVILKNRNGSTGGKINYRYYAWFNYFKEV